MLKPYKVTTRGGSVMVVKAATPEEAMTHVGSAAVAAKLLKPEWKRWAKLASDKRRREKRYPGLR